MNEFHWFAIALVVTTFIALFVLAALRYVAGRYWARTVESIAGVMFWLSALVLLAAYAYLLQASTLNRLIRSEIVPEEPWFAFLHQATILMTPTVMSGILTLFAIVGGFLFAHYLDVLFSLIGYGLQWSNLSREERSAWVQKLVECLLLIPVGLLLVWADAKVFAFRWAYDLSTLEERIGWEASIAHVLQYAYFAGMLFITFVLHRKYRQYQEAAGLLPIEGQEEQPQARTRVSPPQLQQRTTVPSENQGGINGDHEGGRIVVVSPPTGERTPPNQPDGRIIDDFSEDDNEVLSVHFDPFATRRRR